MHTSNVHAKPKKILALSGGVGGAKLALGLAKILPPEQLTIVANTADDFTHLGLTISPDLDTVMYTLADLNNKEQGWGLANESWQTMDALATLGGDTWFRLGDRDLATHLERSQRLAAGESLSSVTAYLCQHLGVKHPLLPMSDDPVRTRVKTAGGELAFQEYFVREQCRPAVQGFYFAGIEQARPQAQWLELLHGDDLAAIIICPSNPFVSVEPMLQLPAVRAAMKANAAPVIAISPIVAGLAIKGPAAKMMQELAIPATAAAVAAYYGDLLDGFVLDHSDQSLQAEIESLGLATCVTPTIMKTLNDRIDLAKTVLSFADKLFTDAIAGKMLMLWALLPLKDFVNAKQRLSGVLAAHERRHLFHTMVEDVLDVLAVHPAIDKVVIVSDDPSAELLAERYGVVCWDESSLLTGDSDGKGLSAVANAAAAKIMQQGADALLVIHGDLPLINATEIQQLIDQHQSAVAPCMTIAPDTIQAGSNCVIVSPANALSFQYGDNSFPKHCEQAKQKKMTVSVVALPGVACDIDNPADLLLLSHATDLKKHTLRYLQESGIADRVISMMTDQSFSLQDNNSLSEFLAAVHAGNLPTTQQALALADDAFASEEITQQLMIAASALRDNGFRNVITYSRKVFIPLTHLCRDVCHYCTFAQTPKHIASPYMSVDDVLASVRAGVAQGCKEALFTLGEKPELRYTAARNALAEMGFATTLDYVAHVAKIVFEETGILPHINAGCMTDDEIAKLRSVSASMGIMLESASSRLCEKGMPHYGSPDKDPLVRLQTIERAGKASVPFTSGILIGIGETRRERIESLLALRDLHQRYGHLQEIIVQNFRAKENTKMSQAPEPDLNELLWTIAVTRLIFGPDMSIQAPPNLSPGVLPKLVYSGINDWGGVSPITPDFVNPEAPWPHVDQLAKETAVTGKYLHERLTIYPSYAVNGKQWLDPALQTAVLQMIDTEGFPRVDAWSPGEVIDLPAEILKQLSATTINHVSTDIKQIVARARASAALTETDVVRLFQARGDDLSYVCQQADQFRQQLNGDVVSYVVTRNINYTNICYFKCQFCAFSKGKLSENLRGRPYDLGHKEIERRCVEAWQRGATEVCMQGGIHPEYTGATYIDILHAVKSVTPDMHVHAFSPLEVWQGAATLNISVAEFLQQLKQAGLNSLPGTAAEILDDEVRAELCPDKINTQQWFSVMSDAHQQGFKTTATIMYGHIEKLPHWARHLLRLRELQQKTGGFTEFVPLPFVHMEAPLYLKGRARKGPTFREAILMHAVARLVLSPFIHNIQTSWVKMGEKGVVACLQAGANDLGGTLMNETITRAAGADHGQECSPAEMQRLISLAGRQSRQRSTVYGSVPEERIEAASKALPLEEVVNTPAQKYDRKSGPRIELIANA